MTEKSLLEGKRILAVDDEPDILETLEALLPMCIVVKASTADQAKKLMDTQSFDVAILDIMGVQGFDLLKIASDRDFPSVVLTAHELNPEALKRSIELGARAYFPKYKLSDLVPYLESVLTTDYVQGWGNMFQELRGHFDSRFGNQWMETDKPFWSRFEAQIASHKKKLIE